MGMPESSARVSAMDAVAVVPVGEGAAELGVAEVIVPEEVGDLGLPGDADGGVREGAEADGDAGSGAGGDGFEAERGVGAMGRGGGGAKAASSMRAFCQGRHEAREIFGIGEEGEDEFDGVGEPLLGVDRCSACGVSVSLAVCHRAVKHRIERIERSIR